MDLTQAAFDHSICIAEIVCHLRYDDKGFPLCDDLLKCGVDAGMYLRDSPDRNREADCLDRVDYPLTMALTAGYLTELRTSRIRESGSEMIEILHENRGVKRR